MTGLKESLTPFIDLPKAVSYIQKKAANLELHKLGTERQWDFHTGNL